MKLVELNWNPAERQLKQFGIACAIAFPVICWLWNANPGVIGIAAGIGAAVAVLAFAVPPAVKPLFIGLSLVAAPIGILVGEIAMLVVYGCVFLPIAIVFQLMARDRLQLRIDKSAATYWRPKKQPTGPASYYRQF